MCPNLLWFMKTKLNQGILWHPKRVTQLTFSHEEQKRRTNIDWSVHCVRSVLSSLSKGGNHLEKVTSINSDTVHQLKFFLALMECRSFKRQCAICQHWFSHCTVILRVVEQDWCICNYLCQTFFAQNEQSVVIIILESASIFSINRFYQQC